MPRGVYQRRPRANANGKQLMRTSAAEDEAIDDAAATIAAAGEADATELNTTTPSTELIRLLTLERDRHLARARIITACMKALE